MATCKTNSDFSAQNVILFPQDLQTPHFADTLPAFPFATYLTKLNVSMDFGAMKSEIGLVRTNFSPPARQRNSRAPRYYTTMMKNAAGSVMRFSGNVAVLFSLALTFFIRDKEYELCKTGVVFLQ